MLKEIIIAFQSYRDAHRFIRENKLWKWIVIPGLIYTILFFLGIYLFWITSNTAIKFLLQASGVKAWLDGMHDRWISYLFILGQIMIHLILLLFYFSLFKFLFLIIINNLFIFFCIFFMDVFLHDGQNRYKFPFFVYLFCRLSGMEKYLPLLL